MRFVAFILWRTEWRHGRSRDETKYSQCDQLSCSSALFKDWSNHSPTHIVSYLSWSAIILSFPISYPVTYCSIQGLGQPFTYARRARCTYLKRIIPFGEYILKRSAAIFIRVMGKIDSFCCLIILWSRDFCERYFWLAKFTVDVTLQNKQVGDALSW